MNIKYNTFKVYGVARRSFQQSLGLGSAVLPRRARTRGVVLRSSVFGLRSSPKGFTLMELLVVIVVIAVLMGLSFPAIQGAIQRARITRARSEVQTLQQAWLAYWNTYYEPATDTPPRFWPMSTPMNAAAVAVLAGEDNDANPLGIAFMEFDAIHLEDGFVDPWRNLYQIALRDNVTVESQWTYQTRVFLGNTARDRY